MKEIFQILRRRWKLTVSLLFGLFIFSVGVGVSGAYVLAYTSTEEFCTGCHEMTYNLAEYKGTIHDTNRTGVRAICTNCHVPHEPGPLVWAKIKASKDVFYTYISPSIDTPAKFEAKRATMAHRVWKDMIESDSHQCRSCHRADKMSVDLQSEKAQKRHAKAKEDGKTCIECHFGIAHHEPEGPGPSELFGKAAAKTN
ncbi:NapC/NirT family cytochrome c [Rhodoferax sp.]|uniref:NapC/NirT family cytochrome c n=1 Tax=Rhodoferax sp. TaxID=50421 RepID=UPI0026169CA0|nr:NapC/NirT family cytochrome c [Rhodoferax sp.]MDD2808580.1 NapC/NirT family cytochrome c [Rhodoferax sp.]MDD4944339.1 NapC/NirT family cytochrome c [Rhodoferax sp.]MDD5478969.1 NapC/NirT family cytochrome c [Rhodoferax sp.]